MFPKKLLILLFNLIFIIGISACASLYNKEYQMQIFVDKYQDKLGIIIRNSLLSYFPNQQKETTKYTIKIISQSFNENLFLTTKEGLASRGSITLNASWALVNNETEEFLTIMRLSFSESYNIEASSFTTLHNKERAKEHLAKLAANDIKNKSYSMLHHINQLNNESSS